VTMEPIDEYPKDDKGEFGRTVALGSIAAIGDAVAWPLGSMTAWIASHVVASPLAKRQEEWHMQIAEGLQSLSQADQSFDLEQLAGSAEFTSTVYAATHIAMKTHLEERRLALLNVVLNTASGVSIDEALRGRFLNCLEEFSPNHLNVLRIAHDTWAFERCAEVIRQSRRQSMFYDAILAELPSLDEETLIVIDEDLVRHGFIVTLNTGIAPEDAKSTARRSRTTRTGKAFLRFISSPLA
jgi:hypothetical protein